jgi:hypothetical protein
VGGGRERERERERQTDRERVRVTEREREREVFLTITNRLKVQHKGAQTDLLTPWYNGWAEIIPFRYLPVLLEGKGTSHVG